MISRELTLHHLLKVWTSLASCLGFCLAVQLCQAAETIDFNRDIRPILSENCFQCHGPDESSREAELRLDTFEGATALLDGHAAIVPTMPDKSELIQRITHEDSDLVMPPTDSDKSLTKQQTDLLKRWIAAGAEYSPHWSFQTVRRPTLPSIPKSQASWVRSSIDAFIVAKLQQHNLLPSEAADKRVLIRRLYLDLLGITPGPEDVARFVSDTSPSAYDGLVDRVLGNPHFGERWGRHWLDQARYADSHGYTNDNERVIWPYRDWVIAAMNADQSFDQFTKEQLAGDLLPDPRLDQLVATGFHRNTLINSEGGTKADQFRDEQVKDRVDTTGIVWMGLTVGCAKCHTHKYDPIQQSEYYELYSFFNSTVDRNSVAPTIQVPSTWQSEELTSLADRIAELKKQIASDSGRPERQRLWETKLLELAGVSEDGTESDDPWTVVKQDAKSKLGATFQTLDDQSLLVGGPSKPTDEYKMTVRSELTTVRSVRVEALKHESLPAGGPGRASNGNFVLSEFWFRTGDGRELRFNKAYADHSQPKYDVTKSIDNNDGTGWAINGSPEGGANHNRVAWFTLPEPLEIEANHALIFTMQFNNNGSQYNLGRIRISLSPDLYIHKPAAGALAKLAAISPEKRSDSQRKQLDNAFLSSDEKLASIDQELKSLADRRDKLSRSIPSTMILRQLPKLPDNFVHVRGDFLRPGDSVQCDVPDALPSLPDASGDSQRTRLDFANWLTDSEHPLTARVRVNRIWMRLFGRGIVETENDFGTQGSLPSHPQLLDWLASEYMQQGWSTKKLIRQIVTSATYRQSSRDREDLVEADPRNILLGRQNRIRVEAEIVRDLALSASGNLSHKIGGPSVYPPQPDGVYAFTQRKKNWRTSSGEDRYRRGMYTFFYRSAPYPMLSTFDVPKFNTVCTARGRSNTPLQSLTVANSEAMFELAGALATRVIRERSQIDERIASLFQLALSRQPSEQEKNVLQTYISKLNQQSEADRSDDFIWTAAARVIINLDEFITRE